ncbi:hypothetical protein NON20_06325 [Synechocystis sp. B12]|nr:hypothetical protein NON20_06325 [Synechocystis sp. B12]
MKYSLKKLLGFGLILILTAIALISLRSKQVLQPLIVGMNDWPGYSVILYAESKGLFTKRGLDVKLVHFEEQNDNLRATMRGYQDASFAPYPRPCNWIFLKTPQSLSWLPMFPPVPTAL